jgi:hypothetical protein
MDEHFAGPALDEAVWLPHYLPSWSSRAATRASYELRDSCLRLFIPPEQGLWLPGEHEPPLRVSGIQSGNQTGQQPWREGAAVREEQAPFRGWTPTFGRFEMRARATITPRSMVAWWLVGLEDVPERCAEICVMEVFGDAVEPGRSAGIGAGLHRFRDPDGVEDFDVVRRDIDVAEFHTYAVQWSAERVDFFVDGLPLRSCAGPPAYPMQMMLAVFDFPAKGGDPAAVPELVVDRIAGPA